jgi:hypothetical protein
MNAPNKLFNVHEKLAEVKRNFDKPILTFGD